MSTKRKWKLEWSYGYAGTDNYETVDIVDDFGWSEEQLADSSDEEVEKEVNNYCWEMAIEQVDAYATSID